MGIIDTIKSFLSGHDKEVDELIGKAGDMAKNRFAGHASEIDSLVGQARQHTGGGDTTITPPAAGTPNPAGPGMPAPTTPTSTPASTIPATPTGPTGVPASEPLTGEQIPSTGEAPQR